jgi:uncharacterized protein
MRSVLNNLIGMRSLLITCLILITSLNAVAQSATAFDILSLGRSYSLHSNALGEDRRIHVYLPLGYDSLLAQSYDVIYLMDGSLDEDFLHITGIVQYLNFPWIEGRAPSIVVGIENVDRRRDFTFPTTVAADKEQWPTTGHSFAFITFIASELQPFVAAQFRISDRRIFIGQSLGGLLGAQIYLEKNEIFTDYLLISPSLWWDNGSLLDRYKQLKPVALSSAGNLLIAVGDEGRIMIGNARKLHRLLKKRSPVHSVDCLRIWGYNHGDIGHVAVLKLLQRLQQIDAIKKGRKRNAHF